MASRQRNNLPSAAAPKLCSKRSVSENSSCGSILPSYEPKKLCMRTCDSGLPVCLRRSKQQRSCDGTAVSRMGWNANSRQDRSCTLSERVAHSAGPVPH